MPKADDVQNMFDRIAGRYDLLNRVMTMGIDKRWRRAAVDAAHVTSESRVLDVCCGTGDLTFEVAERGVREAVGIDFSANMLAQARERVGSMPATKTRNVTFLQGDALALPFEDDSFDALTVGFGVRNVEDLAGALAEFNRVVRPAGRVIVLEITRPDGALQNSFYNVWFDRVVPFVGGVISGDREAYSYLPESTKAFPKPPRLADMMRDAGFGDVDWRTFGGGIVAMHSGTVARTAGNDGASESTAQAVGASRA